MPFLKTPCITDSIHSSILLQDMDFSAYFETFTAPTKETPFLFVLSMLALDSADSIRFLYLRFLSKVTKNFICVINEYENLDIIRNARHDFVLSDEITAISFP